VPGSMQTALLLRRTSSRLSTCRRDCASCVSSRLGHPAEIKEPKDGASLSWDRVEVR